VPCQPCIVHFTPTCANVSWGGSNCPDRVSSRARACTGAQIANVLEPRSDEWLRASSPFRVSSSPEPSSACSRGVLWESRGRPTAIPPRNALERYCRGRHDSRIDVQAPNENRVMPLLPKPPMDLSRSHPQCIEVEEEGSSNGSAPPDSLRQLAEWRAQAVARRSFGPAPRKKR
jgi:hypothetical protein